MTPPAAQRTLVSIIVPVYNGARYVAQALDSILAQTYAPLEVIVMDDASTDESGQIAQSYGDRIEYHRNSTNLGQFDNVNAGILKARGEFIAVYHADDVYSPTTVAREITCFEQWPDAGAVFGKDTFIDGDGCEYGRLTLPPEVRGERPLGFATILNALLTYQNTFLVGPSAMVRAEVYREVGPYRPDPWGDSADLEMWIRIARRYPVVILDDYLLKYRHFPQQAHRRYNRLRIEPALHFVMMDDLLQNGGRPLATPEALAAHEAHRTQDRLMNAVNQYIRGDLDAARSLVDDVRLGLLVGSRRIQRARMVAVYAALCVMVSLPRFPLVAALFEWRWQSGRHIGPRRTLARFGRMLRTWWQGTDAVTR